MRVALVGAGYVARYHLDALRRLDFVDIVAICDIDEGVATALANRYRIPRVARNLDELGDLPIDAVWVLTPPASHCEVTLQALDRGCHVFVEKPMADSVEECDRMIARAETAHRVLTVNHSDRFDPVIARAIALARDGTCGTVLTVDVLRSSDYPAYAGGPLPALVTQGSYPFRDLGVHALYVIEDIAGPIQKLDIAYRGTGANPNLRFDEWYGRAECGGALGRVFLSWNVRPMENRVIVHGTHAVVEADRFLQVCRVVRLLPGPKFVGLLLSAFANALADVFRIPWNVVRFAAGALKPSPGIQRHAELVARALHEGRPPPVSPEEGRHVVALITPICAAADAERSAELAARRAPLAPADVLVTGAAGFIGRPLVAALRARGQRVRVLVRRPVAEWAGAADVQTVVGDLGDPGIVDHVVDGVRIVYHLGAAMRGSERDFESGTVWGTRNVVDACLAHRIDRLVYVSSLSVMDHAGRDPAVPLVETSPLEPTPERRGAYTRTKSAAEALVREAIATRQLPAVIIRPGQVFGPGAERVTPNGTVALGGLWVAVGPGRQTLPLVYRDDVVDALLAAATAPGVAGRTFNVVDPEAPTQSAYLARCRERFDGRPRIMRVPVPVFMLLASGVEFLGKLLHRSVPLTRYRVRSLRPLANFDVAAARDGLGWQPRVGVHEGLDRTFGPA